MREFGVALTTQATTVAWAQVMSRLRIFSDLFLRRERVVELKKPKLRVRQFPLQRGYSREALKRLVRFEDRLLGRLAQTAKQAPAGAGTGSGWTDVPGGARSVPEFDTDC